jgi:hypothetical protein
MMTGNATVYRVGVTAPIGALLPLGLPASARAGRTR